MSNAIGQNATALALSPVIEEEFPFRDVIERLAIGKIDRLSTTRSKVDMVQSSLSDRCKAIYLATYTQYSKRLPDHVWLTICTEVDKFISDQLTAIPLDECVSKTTKDRYHERLGFHLETRIVSRQTSRCSRGYELKLQHNSACRMIREAKARLEKMQLDTTDKYDPDDIHKLSEKIVKYESERADIRKSIVAIQVAAKGKVAIGINTPVKS